MQSIELLKKYFTDIPADLQPEVRAFLDEYEEKKEKHFTESLEGLKNEELEKILYFRYSDIGTETLPDKLGLCKNLKVLEIVGPIKNINVIARLTKLRILEIRASELTEWKNILSKLVNLWALDIEDGESSFDFSKEINRLSNLLICSLMQGFEDYGFISSFPKDITNVIFLDVFRQDITTLPDLSTFSNLVHLDLYGNKIETIPESIGKLKKLRYLNIGNNKLNNLPNKIFNLSNLKEIFLSENPYEDTSYFKVANQIFDNSHEKNQLPFLEMLKTLNKPTEQDNHNYFNLKIPKSLQTPMLQYIEFFKDYVEATKGKEIIFDVKRDKEGLILVTNGNSNVTLLDLGTYFQEYVSLTQQQSEDWIFNFEQPTSAMKADILRLKMENEIGRLKNAFQIAKLESQHLSNQLSDTKAENEFLKGLSKSFVRTIEILSSGKTAETLNVDQLLLDIQDQAVRMLERKSNHQLEDLHNDILTEFLRQKGYYTTDQTRSGRSKLGVGEIDIMIRKKNGTPFSIIEAFRLNSCGPDNKTVAQHLDKLLHDYDTAGHERNFVIVYAEAVNFERLWKNYQNYVSELNGKPSFRADYPLISFKEKTEISNKSSIKIGLAKHRREGSIVEIYHVFINMFA